MPERVPGWDEDLDRVLEILARPEEFDEEIQVRRMRAWLAEHDIAGFAEGGEG